MAKYCVFCGNKPQDKNKEHIIPRWLINKTGNPTRNINLGIDMRLENNGERVRSHAFDKLTLPACEKCNSQFGKIEEKVKCVIESILEHNCMRYEDISILLDWLDKVRIGLWHYFYIMNGNIMDIDPHFHINSRVRAFDRMLIIYKVPGMTKGINFIGTDTMAFQLMPSAFLFRINDYYFLNISKEFLLARRFGFPFLESKEYVNEQSDQFVASIVAGTGKMRLPLLKYSFLEGGTEVYQPILFDIENKELFRKLYDNEYVRQHCLDWNGRLGKPEVIRVKKCVGDEKEELVRFYEIYSDAKLFHIYMAMEIYKCQIELIKNTEIGTNNLSDEIKRIYDDKANAAIRYNKFIIEKLEKELKEIRR